MSRFFGHIAQKAAEVTGTPRSFLSATACVLVWAATGPHFHFSDTWQLVINTGTSVITFLLVFVIQSTQNRDAKAMHLKLDELIRSVGAARNHLVRLEELSDEELSQLANEFHRIRVKLKPADVEKHDGSAAQG